MINTENTKLSQAGTLITILAWQYIIIYTDGGYGVHDIVIGLASLWTLFLFRRKIYDTALNLTLEALIVGASIIAIFGGLFTLFTGCHAENQPLECTLSILPNANFFGLNFYDYASFLIAITTLVGFCFKSFLGNKDRSA